MNLAQLERQYLDFKVSLFREGLLDDQFTQLQKLADESNPTFVVEVVSLFFEDSEKLLNNLTQAIEQPIVDFKQAANHAHQFKGSSSSIGAHKVKNVCISFKNHCESENLEGCRRCLQQVKHEYALVKSKLENSFLGSSSRLWPLVEQFLPQIKHITSKDIQCEREQDEGSATQGGDVLGRLHDSCDLSPKCTLVVMAQELVGALRPSNEALFA
ncbi:hypothetical protein Ancab_019410 [Ancistrocladus abbreviatus]